MRDHILTGTTPVEIRGNSLFIYAKNKFQEQGMNLNKVFLEGIIEQKFKKPLGMNIIVNEAAEKVRNEVLVVEEESKVEPVNDIYKVEGETAESTGKIPAGLDKILDKFPGRVSKKK